MQRLISSGKAPARQLAHTRILLKMDRNEPGCEWTNEQFAEMVEMIRYTVMRMRERFVEPGLDDALNYRHALRMRSRPWMGNRKRTWLHWHAASNRMDKNTGRYDCLPIAW